MGLFSLSSLEGIGELITSVRESLTGKRIVDPVELAKIDIQLEELGLAVSKGQVGINLQEAKHSSTFVAGARPFILWVCGIGLAYASIIDPLLRFVALVIFGYEGIFPIINTDITLQVLLGMLGLGGLRSFEKTKGIERNSLKPDRG